MKKFILIIVLIVALLGIALYVQKNNSVMQDANTELNTSNATVEEVAEEVTNDIEATQLEAEQVDKEFDELESLSF